jgi:hypothetical protein
VSFRATPVRLLPVLLAAVLATGCAPKDPSAPARQAIEQIDAAIDAAGDQATKYIPGQVAATKGQVTQLKIRFFDGDYQGILDAAPAILGRAQGLSAAAAAKKAEIWKVLDAEWASLAREVPEEIDSARKYVDEALQSKQPPPGVSEAMLESAKIGLQQQKELWDKALAAKAAGDLEQALTIGTNTKRKVENLVAALGGRNAG